MSEGPIAAIFGLIIGVILCVALWGVFVQLVGVWVAFGIEAFLFLVIFAGTMKAMKAFG